MPSMVVISLPSDSMAKVRHEHTGFPSTITVHPEHAPRPQINLVPVSSNLSRSTSTRVSSGLESTFIGRPLMFNLSAISSGPCIFRLSSALLANRPFETTIAPAVARPEPLKKPRLDIPLFPSGRFLLSVFFQIIDKVLFFFIFCHCIED